MIKWVKSFYTAFLYKKYDIQKSYIMQYHNSSGKLKYKVVSFQPTDNFMSLNEWIQMKVELKMAKSQKKLVRENFRSTVFKRDDYKCVMCKAKPPIEELDAHHITDRTLMPNGGYIKENGITLCKECHLKAEQFHNTGQAASGFSPDDLYTKINSDYNKAVEKSKLLK